MEERETASEGGGEREREGLPAPPVGGETGGYKYAL